MFFIKAAQDESHEDVNYVDSDKLAIVTNVRLTRTELADSLGLKPSSMFVRNIFLLIDKDGDGFVTFHEFLGVFSVFLKGEFTNFGYLEILFFFYLVI